MGIGYIHGASGMRVRLCIWHTQFCDRYDFVIWYLIIIQREAFSVFLNYVFTSLFQLYVWTELFTSTSSPQRAIAIDRHSTSSSTCAMTTISNIRPTLCACAFSLRSYVLATKFLVGSQTKFPVCDNCTGNRIADYTRKCISCIKRKLIFMQFPSTIFLCTFRNWLYSCNKY